MLPGRPGIDPHLAAIATPAALLLANRSEGGGQPGVLECIGVQVEDRLPKFLDRPLHPLARTNEGRAVRAACLVQILMCRQQALDGLVVKRLR